MSIILLAADSDTLVAATDRRTIMETPEGPQVERDDQIKSTAIFDKLGVATVGTEYLFDPDRFDPKEILEHGFAVDQLAPDRPRDEYKRHHLAGESSVIETIEAWSVIPENWETATDENSDHEKIHWGITQMLNHTYSVARSWQVYAERHAQNENVFVEEGRMTLFSLGFDRDEGGRIYQGTFDLSRDRHTVDVNARPLVRTSELGPGQVWTYCIGGDIDGMSEDWWQQFFHETLGEAISSELEHPIARSAMWTGLRAIELAEGKEEPKSPASIGGGMDSVTVTSTELVRMAQAPQ